MAIGHALEDVLEFCGGDKGADGGPANPAAVGAGEEMVLTPERDGVWSRN